MMICKGALLFGGPLGVRTFVTVYTGQQPRFLRVHPVIVDPLHCGGPPYAGVGTPEITDTGFIIEVKANEPCRIEYEYTITG